MNSDVHGGRSEAGAQAPVAPGAYLRHMKRYRRVFSRSLRLRPGEWFLLAQMSVMLSALLILQRFLPLPRLMALYDPEPAESPRPKVEPRRLVTLVTALVRITLRDRFCMKRSILIFHFLQKWGYDARIYFGVVKEANELQGHAWVELDGKPMAERGDPRKQYAVTYSYPVESNAS